MGLVLAAVWGTLGDVLPFVAVGAELRKRGCDVTFVSNPVFEEQARRAGISFVPVGTEAQYREFVEDPGLWDRDMVVRTVVRHFLPTTEAFYDAIMRAHRPGKTVLFSTRGILGAQIAREKLGMPFALGVVAPSRVGSRLDPAHPSRPLPAGLDRLGRTRWGLRLLHWLNSRRARLRGALGKTTVSGSERAALDEAKRVRALAGLPERPSASALPEPVLSICFWPSWFSPPQVDWPAGARVVGFPFFPKPADRPGEAAGGDGSRPVVFTRGSSASHQRPFFTSAVECCRLLGRPGVLVTPKATDVPPELPPEIRHVPFTNFGELFGQAAAVVHHGGIGTIAYALAAGIPQVVIPIVGEQFDLGYRVERLGVGSMLTRTPLTARGLAGTVGALLGSTRTLHQCERIRDQVDTEAGSSLAADWLQRLVAESRPE